MAPRHKVDKTKMKPLDLLQDGEWHPRIEFVEKCTPPTVQLVSTYIGWNRKLLKDDEMIICEYKNRCIGFRMVRRYRPN